MTHLASQRGFSYAESINNFSLGGNDLMDTPQPTQPGPAPASTPTPPPTSHKASNGLATTALVVGIVAFCVGWTGPFGLLLAIVAVIFGIIALVKKQSKGMGITGIVLGGLALVTALIVTMVGVAIFGGAVQVANKVNQEQQAIDNTKKDFATGDVAKLGDLTVKVNTFTQPWQPTDGFSTAKDGYEFVYVSLNIKNTGSDDKDVNPFDFKLNDSGVVTDHEIATTPTPLNAVQLKAGSAVDGDLVFQVKKGATGLKLQYTTRNNTLLREVNYTLGLN